MGDHNYVNNWPDHSKLLHPDTHLDGEGAEARDGRKNRQIDGGGGGRRVRRDMRNGVNEDGGEGGKERGQSRRK